MDRGARVGRLFFRRSIQRSSFQTKEETGLTREVHAEDSIEEKCRKLCYIGTEALQQTCTLIEPEQIRAAVDCLFQARCVYCFGQGNSSITAMEAWGRFSSVTHKFHWISDVHMQAYTASLLGPQDVVLYFSCFTA